MVCGALATNRRIGRVPEFPDREPAQRTRGFEERRAQATVDASGERLEEQGEHLVPARWSHRAVGRVGVRDEHDAGEAMPTASQHGAWELGAVARVVESPCGFGERPTDLGRNCRDAVDAVDAQAVAVGMHDHDVVGECLPTCFERRDRERRLPRAAMPQEEQRAPVAHDRGAMEDKAVIAREQPRERQVHATFEEGKRSKVGKMHVCPGSLHGDDEPGRRGDDDPIRFVPEPDPEQLRTRRASWRYRGRCVDRDRGHRLLARRLEALEARVEARVALVVRRPQRDGHTCDVDDTGWHEPRRVASLCVITEPPGSPPNSSAQVDLFPGFSTATLQTVLGEHPVALRHAFADDPQFAPDVLAPLVAALPASWIRADHAQYSPHEPRGVEPLPADADLEAAVRALPTSPASIRAYNLEHTSEFRDLHAALDAPVRALVGNAEGGVVAVNLGAFVASPDAVTPAHPDRHHNLLLAVSGRKEVWVEDDPDQRAHHLRVVDYLRSPQNGAPVLPPARCFILGPGDGVYIPPYAFHWTTVLDGPALGLSVGFSTPSTVRSSRVHDLDVRLRRRGLRPRPSGPGSTKEKVKARLATASVQAARIRDRMVKRRTRGTVATGQEGHDER